MSSLSARPGAAYFKAQAQRCRRLAQGADYVTALALKEMQAEYKAKAAVLAALENASQGQLVYVQATAPSGALLRRANGRHQIASNSIIFKKICIYANNIAL